MLLEDNLKDKRREGWILMEDTNNTKLFLPSQLKLVSFLREGEIYISGEELVKRAKEMGANLGQAQAEHLLKHQQEIPEDWEKFYYYLLFAGTSWRDRDGRRYVPCLYRRRRWGLSFYCFFGSSGRLLRPRK